MADNKPKHQHHKNDIIIKDQDGSFKILQEGKFVPLDEAEAKEHGLTQTNDKKTKPHMPKGSIAEPMPMFQGQTRKEDSGKKEEHEVKGLGDQGLQKQAQDLVKKSGVTFASGEAQQRVIKVLVSHLKGVRKPFETKQSLMKSPADGGVGLGQDEADKILAAAGVKTQMPQIPKEQMPKPAPESSFAKAMDDKKKKASIMPMGQDLSAPAAMPKEVKAQESKPKAPLPPVQTQKPQIMDVQKPKMPTVGLAGELSYSLADWRRVSVNPQDRIKKIENQLGVLEEESFPMRLRGLKAWRDSEVMKLYLDAGKESLEKGQPLEQLLGQGSASELTWEEWQAIAELNQRIRA